VPTFCWRAATFDVSQEACKREGLDVRVIVSGNGSHRYVDCVPMAAGEVPTYISVIETMQHAKPPSVSASVVHRPLFSLVAL
jgi:hypothetical protein